MVTHSSNLVIMFANNMKVVGLITDYDEMADRGEANNLTECCQEKKSHAQCRLDLGADRGLQEERRKAGPNRL